MRIAKVITTGLIVAAGIGVAQAQSTAASGSVLVVPLVAQTVSYTTEVTVYNPNAGSITVGIDLYEGTTSSTPGHRSCGSLTVSSHRSRAFAINAQCPGAATGGHFGMLVLSDAASQKTNVFFAYSRTQTPGGNGFSVEGFPIGAFSGAEADVVGLKRQAAAPVYQSNCYVAALSEAVGYQLVLRDGSTNNFLGSTSGSLQPFEMVRMLDVFGSTGVAPGDVSNARANVTVQGAPPFPALVSFCTVQESTFFGADFRIAKSVDALNEREKRVACIGMDDCSGNQASTSRPETIADPASKNVYSMIITQPDFVQCTLVGTRASEMQMQLRGPGNPFASTPVAGGADQTAFYASTGARGAVDDGTATRWFVDVSARAGATGTFDFGITCRSGNGTEIPWFRGTAARDF